MDDFRYMFSYAMEKAMTMVVYCMFAALIEKSLENERRKVKSALGHEPTPEDWQDYYNLKQEKGSTAGIRQREIDHEKLRRLVFGEDGGDTKSS